MNDKEFIDEIHVNIHALRLLPNYKPTEFERKINKMIVGRYSSSCKECRDRRSKVNEKPKNILNTIGDMLNKV